MQRMRQETDSRPISNVANDDTFGAPSLDKSGVSTSELVNDMLDAPSDLPSLKAARAGLKAALSAVASFLPSARALSIEVAAYLGSIEIDNPVAVAAETAAALSKRRGRHPLYLCLIALGGQKPTCASVAAVIGIWVIRRCLDGWTPKAQQFSRCFEVLSKPSGAAARRWPPTERERYVADNLHDLDIAISANATVASRLGLVATSGATKKIQDSLEAFNRRFRRRIANLFDYKPVNVQAAAGGNGTLTAAALRTNGRELLTGFRAADPVCLGVGLEIVSHLTSDLIQHLPVQLKDVPPQGALAWLSVPDGEYCYVLFQILDRGARPDRGTEGLYEKTTQVVRIPLTPPLAAGLQSRARGLAGDFTTGAKLLGVGAHGPHAAVAGRGPYRATAAKFQASVPALLVQQGASRWAAAVTTTSPYLVSLGRPSYSAIRSTTIEETAKSACSLLGWPSPPATSDVKLIGAHTVPLVLAVVAAVAALKEEADSHDMPASNVDAVVACLNAHAAFLALLLSLAYALRRHVVYDLPTASLRSGKPLKFNDKDVHDVSMPAVPTLQIVGEAMRGWERLIREANRCMEGVDSEDACALHQALSERLQDDVTPGWVFTIDAAGALVPVGTGTWQMRLPRSMRLVGNFGRQFWPIHLADLTVTQRDIDMLMRHQMPAHHPGSIHNPRAEHEAHEALLRAMTVVVHEKLKLQLPERLSDGAS